MRNTSKIVKKAETNDAVIFGRAAVGVTVTSSTTALDVRD